MSICFGDFFSRQHNIYFTKTLKYGIIHTNERQRHPIPAMIFGSWQDHLNGDANMFNHLAGAKLKEFRLQSGVSIAAAAEAVGVTPSFISMVENGKSGISVQKLEALLALYGKALSDFAATASSESPIINLSAAPVADSKPGVKTFRLAKDENPPCIGGYYLYFEPGAQIEYDHPEGAEYVLILKGSIDLLMCLPSQKPGCLRHLRKGDTTICSAGIPHSFRNTSDDFSSLFVVEIDKNRQLSSPTEITRPIIS